MLTLNEREDRTLPTPNGYREWLRDTLRDGLLPVIGIAGTSGKSTVVRMLDAIFRQAGLRTASWTDRGVEIMGQRQDSELGGWELALAKLASGTVDVALQELHWSTVKAVGLPPGSYPALALTNLRGLGDAYWSRNALSLAEEAAMAVARAAHPRGILVLNGDDYSLVDALAATAATPIVVGYAKESPGVSRHLQSARPAAWTSDNVIHLSDGVTHRQLTDISLPPITLGGEATFEIANLLSATAIASAVGIDDATIASALVGFAADADALPGSFNVWESPKLRVVVSTVEQSWVLRQILRAINPGAARRQLTVLGNIGSLDSRDATELGRLLGRNHGAIILHGEHDEVQLEAFRHGITANEYPPLIIHVTDERRAIRRVMQTAREDDVVLLIPGEDAEPSLRAATELVAS